MKLVICGPNLPGNTETFHVHAEGCADLKKAMYRHADGKHDQGGYVEEHTSRQSVVEETFSDMIDESGGEWTDYEGEFRFFRCLHDRGVFTYADPDA